MRSEKGLHRCAVFDAKRDGADNSAVLDEAPVGNSLSERGQAFHALVEEVGCIRVAETGTWASSSTAVVYLEAHAGVKYAFTRGSWRRLGLELSSRDGSWL